MKKDCKNECKDCCYRSSLAPFCGFCLKKIVDEIEANRRKEVDKNDDGQECCKSIKQTL